MRRAVVLLCASCLTFLPAAILSQGPSDRASLNRLRDSLRITTDTGALRTFERVQRTAVDRDNNKALALVRLGFVQLRQGEVSGDRARFSDARKTFDRALAIYVNWPSAFLGRGLARLNLADNQSVGYEVIPEFLKGDLAKEAADDFVQSGAVDFQFTEGLLRLADLALHYRHAEANRAALFAFRDAAQLRVGRLFEVQLARIRIERLAGERDSAVALAAALLAAHPRDPAVLMESGRLAMMRGDSIGGVDWLRGLELADTATVRWYRSDLVSLLPDSTLRAFDAARGADRVHLLERFFEGSDPGHLHSPVERLREHYRRLDHGRSLFPIRHSVYRADVPLPFVPTGREMDDRGFVWVLHGEPTGHTFLNLTGGPANESWNYEQPDGSEMVFHFVKTDDSTGYRRVASLMDILALTRPAQLTGQSKVKEKTAKGEAIETYGAGWTAQVAQDLLYSREKTSPIYARMLSSGIHDAAAVQAAERAIGDVSLAKGESWTRNFELPLDAVVDAVPVGSDARGTLLQLGFAIPGSSLYTPPTDGRVVYPVRMRASVYSGTRLVAHIDSLRNFVSARPIAPDAVLVGRLAVPVPPGDYNVELSLETPSRGMTAPLQRVHVGRVNGTELDLSDIALGARTVNTSWVSPAGDTVWVNPMREFRNREPMQLYFELAGVPVRGTFRVEVSVFRPGERTAQLSVAFDANSVSTPDAVRREIDIGRLSPGPYQLEVAVSLPSGQRVVRRRELTIIR